MTSRVPRTWFYAWHYPASRGFELYRSWADAGETFVEARDSRPHYWLRIGRFEMRWMKRAADSDA